MKLLIGAIVISLIIGILLGKKTNNSESKYYKKKLEKARNHLKQAVEYGEEFERINDQLVARQEQWYTTKPLDNGYLIEPRRAARR